MDPITFFFGVFLLVLSSVLTAGHLRARRASPIARAEDSESQATLQEDKHGEEEAHADIDESLQQQFARRQFRRRMQASLMIGLAGIAILAAHWIPAASVWYIAYWLGVVALVLWIVLLALADILATQQHFRQERTDQLVEQAKLRAELRQYTHQGNGDDHGELSGELSGE